MNGRAAFKNQCSHANDLSACVRFLTLAFVATNQSELNSRLNRKQKIFQDKTFDILE